MNLRYCWQGCAHEQQQGPPAGYPPPAPAAPPSAPAAPPSTRVAPPSAHSLIKVRPGGQQHDEDCQHATKGGEWVAPLHGPDDCEQACSNSSLICHILRSHHCLLRGTACGTVPRSWLGGSGWPVGAGCGWLGPAGAGCGCGGNGCSGYSAEARRRRAGLRSGIRTAKVAWGVWGSSVRRAAVVAQSRAPEAGSNSG